MRNRLVQIALSSALLLLLIQVVLIAPSHIRDTDNKAAVLPAPELPENNEIDQSIKGMHMIETQDGQKEWELSADQANSLKAKELLELETVKAILFSDSGVTFTVTGKRGRVELKSKNLRVEGDVETRSSNGYVFRTEVVEYNSKKRLLTAPERVEMFGPKNLGVPGMKLTGNGLTASLANSVIEVVRDVKAEKALENGRKAFIRSHRATFSGKDRTAKFHGNVVLDVDNMRITGPAAQFQYDSEAQAVKSVQITGGARVSDTDKWATSQNLQVDFERNKFTFRGSPRVVQNNDELRGEEIVFHDGGKRVQVLRARAKVDEKRLEKTN